MKEKEQQPSIGRLISILHRTTQVYLQREFEPWGLGHGQVKLLHYIDMHPGICQQDLTDFFRLDKGSTSALISGLEKKGFVRREKDPDDKRAYKILITPKAEEIRPIIKKVFRNWTESLMQGFSDQEKTRIVLDLKKMIRNADPDFYNKHHHGEK